MSFELTLIYEGVKAYFRKEDKKLMVIWITALTTFWDGEYGPKLKDIRDSFQLEDIEKKIAK
jgi:hypothetical protein